MTVEQSFVWGMCAGAMLLALIQMIRS